MLKSNRITTAHPGDENTNDEDIEDAITKYFPDVTSPFYIRAMQVVKLLQELHETD
jgi:hypothetical protein